MPTYHNILLHTYYHNTTKYKRKRILHLLMYFKFLYHTTICIYNIISKYFSECLDNTYYNTYLTFIISLTTNLIFAV